MRRSRVPLLTLSPLFSQRVTDPLPDPGGLYGIRSRSGQTPQGMACRLCPFLRPEVAGDPSIIYRRFFAHFWRGPDKIYPDPFIMLSRRAETAQTRFQIIGQSAAPDPRTGGLSFCRHPLAPPSGGIRWNTSSGSPWPDPPGAASDPPAWAAGRIGSMAGLIRCGC